jgi:hypothetical protein
MESVGRISKELRTMSCLIHLKLPNTHGLGFFAGTALEGPAIGVSSSGCVFLLARPRVLRGSLGSRKSPSSMEA